MNFDQIKKVQTMVSTSIIKIALEVHNKTAKENVINAIAEAYLLTYEGDYGAVNIISYADYKEEDFDEYSLYAEFDLYDDLIASGLFVVDGNKVLTLSNGFYEVLEDVKGMV